MQYEIARRTGELLAAGVKKSESATGRPIFWQQKGQQTLPDSTTDSSWHLAMPTEQQTSVSQQSMLAGASGSGLQVVFMSVSPKY